MLKMQQCRLEGLSYAVKVCTHSALRSVAVGDLLVGCNFASHGACCPFAGQVSRGLQVQDIKVQTLRLLKGTQQTS